MSAPAGDQGFVVEEEAVRRLWASRGLPPASGTLGGGSGPVLRQMVGTFTAGDAPVLVAQRAVRADIDARATALAGGRAAATLRREAWAGEVATEVVEPLLEALGVWVGGAHGQPYDAVDRHESVGRMAGRLAELGALVLREGPVRVCPSCAAPRSPERTVYHEELGDTLLVRFPLEPEGDGPSVEALAWVDAAWRLLGTTALLVNPELPYVTVEYRRGDVVARFLTLRSSLGRLKSWLSGAELSIVDERPGKAYRGRRYVYPLRHEFPDGAALPGPSGTVQTASEVGDSGTGVVPLVPGHGGTDAVIAERLGIQGWPLLTVRGTLDLNLVHKYGGLDLETADEFVARDLSEGGSVLARLRVLRGVPHCGVCGHPVVWFPGRLWCLEPGHLPPEQVARFAQLLPYSRPIAEIEVTPWPVSETATTDASGAVTLLECDRCPRLAAPGEPTSCPCGGARRAVSRRLVPSIAGTFAAWARNEPLAPSDPVQLYVSERRRAPAVVHHLAAMTALNAVGTEVRATVVPTLTDVDLVGLVREHGADAVRAAFVRTDISEGPGGSFVERCRQERHRLAGLAALAAAVAAVGPERAGLSAAALGAPERELEPEDRAILARWAGTELKVLAAYEELRPAEAYRRLARFVEVDLGRYRDLVAERLAPGSTTASRRAAARTLASLLGSVATALAPVAPFTAEAIVRAVRAGPRSLFESEPFDVEHPPPDEALTEAWDRWLAMVSATERFRSDRRLPPRALVPSVALVVADEPLADHLRQERPVIERLAGIGRLDVGSPSSPWGGRRRQFVPVESEIQRVYPAIATQIVHLLRRMPPRKLGETAGAHGFSVFVQGNPHQITPDMVSVVETLPDRLVPTPCTLGEMYAELPEAVSAAAQGGGPLLSADATWLVRRLARRLRGPPAESLRTLTLRIGAVDPLAHELREHATAVAASLGVAGVQVDPPPASAPTGATLRGRTRLGARWTVELPRTEEGPARPWRPAGRGPRGATRRLPLRRSRLVPEEAEVDFANDEVVHHGDEIRALGEQLDQLLEAPLVGPAKVSMAWEAGYTSVDGFTTASFDELVTLPGFGRPIAARVFAKLGRPVPPPPRKPPSESVRRGPAERPPATAAPPSVGHLPGEERELARPSAPAVPVAPSSEPVPEPVEAAVGPPAVRPAPQGPYVPVPRPLEEPARPSPPPAPPPPLEPAFVPESARPAPEVPSLPPPAPSGLQVEFSGALLPALQPFLDATAAGERGLAVVRELPERIRALVGPRPVAVYWLSNLSRDRTIRPSDLPALTALVRQGIGANAISAVFLEGIEYLIRIHGTAAVVAFLKELDREAREHGARAWLHLTPGLLPASDLEQLTRELGLPSANAAPSLGPTSST